MDRTTTALSRTRTPANEIHPDRAHSPANQRRVSFATWKRGQPSSRFRQTRSVQRAGRKSTGGIWFRRRAKTTVPNTSAGMRRRKLCFMAIRMKAMHWSTRLNSIAEHCHAINTPPGERCPASFAPSDQYQHKGRPIRDLEREYGSNIHFLFTYIVWTRVRVCRESGGSSGRGVWRGVSPPHRVRLGVVHPFQRNLNFQVKNAGLYVFLLPKNYLWPEPGWGCLIDPMEGCRCKTHGHGKFRARGHSTSQPLPHQHAPWL